METTKTAKEWFEMLNEPERSIILNEFSNFDLKYDSLQNAF